MIIFAYLLFNTFTWLYFNWCLEIAVVLRKHQIKLVVLVYNIFHHKISWDQIKLIFFWALQLNWQFSCLQHHSYYGLCKGLVTTALPFAFWGPWILKFSFPKLANYNLAVNSFIFNSKMIFLCLWMSCNSLSLCVNWYQFQLVRHF